MKSTIQIIVLIGLCASCKQNKTERYVFDFDKITKKEMLLLPFDSGEIFIKFDTIKTIDKYFDVLHSFKKEYPKIYRPFFSYNVLDSFMDSSKLLLHFSPYLFSSGAGYFRPGDEVFGFTIFNKSKNILAGCIALDKIQDINKVNYYRNDSLLLSMTNFFYHNKDNKQNYIKATFENKGFTNKRPFEIKYEPEIYIRYDDSITLFNETIENIIISYISTQRRISKELYNKPIDSLNTNQLLNLRQRMPLNISLKRTHNRKKQLN